MPHPRILTYLSILLGNIPSAAIAQPIEGAQLENAIRLWAQSMTSENGMSYYPVEISKIRSLTFDVPIYKADLLPRGFVIFTGDTRLPPILGYSFEHPLDIKSAPENVLLAQLKNLSAILEKSIALAEPIDSTTLTKRQNESNYIRLNKTRWQELVDTTPKRSARSSTTDVMTIGPLLSTTWDQWQPYNFLTPVNQDCVDYKDGHFCNAPTGCVQTAQAQLMNYYSWPPHGYGQDSYEDAQGDMQGMNSADFNDKFDWKNMWTDYSGCVFPNDCPVSSTGAVSNLMLKLGVNNHANYEKFNTDSNTNVSGLVEHFYYQFPSYLLSTEENFLSTLMNEIKARRPVLANVETNGGHQFVIDGYRNTTGDDFFHMNMGWGGHNDGWYLIDNIPGDYGNSISGYWYGLKPTYRPLPVIAHYQDETENIEVKWSASNRVTPPIKKFRILLPSTDYKLSYVDEAEDLRNWKSHSFPIFGSGLHEWAPSNIDGRSALYSGGIPGNQLDSRFWLIPDAHSSISLSYKLMLTCAQHFDVEVSTDGVGWVSLYSESGTSTYTPWKSIKVDLSPYNNIPISIRISHKYNKSQDCPGGGYYSDGGIWLDNIQILNSIMTTWISVDENISKSIRTYTVENAGTYTHAIRVESMVGGTWVEGTDIRVKGHGVPSSIPATPSSLAATSRVGRKILLTWSDVSNNEDAFVIQRKSANGVWENVGTTRRNHNAYVDRVPAGGERYRYRVKSVNKLGTSAYSNTISKVSKQ